MACPTDAQLEYRQRAKRKHPYANSYMEFIDKKFYGHSSYLGFEKQSIFDKKESHWLRGLNKSSSSASPKRMKCGSIPYAQASAVPFMEPYCASQDKFEELMVLKANGQKELDGNMSTIKRAQSDLGHKLEANRSRQRRLDEEKERLQVERSKLTKKKGPSEGALAISAYLGYRQGNLTTEYAQNHVTPISDTEMNPHVYMMDVVDNSCYPNTILDGYKTRRK